MIFTHNEEILNERDEPKNSYKFIFLSSEEKDSEYEIVAAAISIDIRGHFGRVLKNIEQFKDKYREANIWKGNLFAVKLQNANDKFKDGRVSVCLLDDEEDSCVIGKGEFVEAMEDWKAFYLERMGFNEFKNSKTLSHIYASLMLAYDKLGEEKIKKIPNELFIYSMLQCAERYGITYSTIKNQCRSVTPENSIFQFRELASKFLIDNDYTLIDLMEQKFGNSYGLRSKFLSIIS